MSRGQADPQKLYFAGKLKLSGNVMAAQKLQFITKIDKAAVDAALAKARGTATASASAAKPAAPAAAPPIAARAPAIFAALEKRLAENPALAGELGAVATFQITAPDAAWTVDLAKGPGSVRAGKDPAAAATLTISDEDFTALVQNPAAGRDFFQRGKLRVDGDVRVAQRLGFLKGLA
jgi:3-hydroxyacyl-CoA dehydrogenase/3a,7a,12a-trihydroxy-5b-cholest-24-enoyl-CoA hydratase